MYLCVCSSSKNLTVWSGLHRSFMVWLKPLDAVRLWKQFSAGSGDTAAVTAARAICPRVTVWLSSRGLFKASVLYSGNQNFSCWWNSWSYVKILHLTAAPSSDFWMFALNGKFNPNLSFFPASSGKHGQTWESESGFAEQKFVSYRNFKFR